MKKKIFLTIFCVIILASLLFWAVISYFREKQYRQELADLAQNQQNCIFSVDKIYCYSTANAINNSESKARWNLAISQYTDIAIFLKIHNVNLELTQALQGNATSTNSEQVVVEKNAKNKVTRLWIDEISFSNENLQNLSLNYQSIANFGKWEENLPKKVSSISYEIAPNSSSLQTVSTPQIDEALSFPITLRFQNSNIKSNHIITDISTPLSFDGSILKRCSIPISSIKTSITMKIHIVNALGEEYTTLLTFDIPLQSEDRMKSIYDGSYSKELNQVELNFLKI